MIFVMLGLAEEAKAQRVAVSAPTHVAAGENFRVAYTVNAREVEEFRMGNVPDGLEVIAGPYTSSQSSYQVVNGHTSSSSSFLCATFNQVKQWNTLSNVKDTDSIGTSHALVYGKKLAAHPVKITVSGHAHNSGGAPRMHNDDADEPRMRQAGSAISGKDLFIKVTANKKRVHEQEPILLTYKVYTLVDLT